MEPYSGVVTTAIYCRPGCPARPDPRNTIEFPDPAAAEAAGFRACLRCRPYRSPTPANGDAPDLVCRAVRLIVAGALDGAGEDPLAARLGVSARHLRRLFALHVGATPGQVARSRRAHFARRLLDDTDLTVTEVAFASGYGSVRQLNRACKDVFRATPVELRARRRRADRLAADGGLTLRLPFRGTVDWPAFLAYFAVRAIPGVESVDAAAYRRTIVVDGDPGMLEVTTGGADHLLMRAHLPHWEGLIHVVERVRRIFGLDTDIDAAAATLRGDPLTGPLVDARPGLRVPGAWDPFEVGVRAILGQQVTVSGASTLAARLVERHGTPVPGLGPVGLRQTFPTPESLAVADLDGLGITGTRIAAIRAFARAVAAGEVRLDGTLGLDDLVAAITRLPGLGPWTAGYLALRLGERDAFPATDLGLIRSAGALVGRREPTARWLAERAEAWRPWRALAAVHLWTADVPGPAARRALDPSPVAPRRLGRPGGRRPAGPPTGSPASAAPPTGPQPITAAPPAGRPTTASPPADLQPTTAAPPAGPQPIADRPRPAAAIPTTSGRDGVPA
jgi:AraC family transcriptional regulator of adaptative response / DNA-3-methyladenine glycosylase II